MFIKTMNNGEHGGQLPLVSLGVVELTQPSDLAMNKSHKRMIFEAVIGLQNDRGDAKKVMKRDSISKWFQVCKTGERNTLPP